METLTTEELRDLLLALAPIYVATFSKEDILSGTAGAARKLYGVIKAEYKHRVGETQYDFFMKEVIEHCRQLADVSTQDAADSFLDSLQQLKDVAKKI